MALRTRYAKSAERLNRSSRELPPLRLGDACFIQNQRGNHPLKWERSGAVVEVLPHNQYTVKVDGSGCLTTRNRKFIRRFSPQSTAIERAPLLRTEMSTPSNEMAPTIPIQHVPATSNSQNPSPPQPPRRQNIPAPLKCLMPHNNPGLKEDTTLPLRRLRPC